ncbi:hypothetical protein WICPIJ_006373 [Wickerhamomyces pijperi]|uniref:SIS domain-containing protein n=1 Tax=Wickerhamomyces pijperi TaxID=599730 RepID=A0A9P8Q4D6_WICPI|nr:hypothetical protein WICPIJ_006373 [Wickerhamomyces pijperi]
MITSSEAKPQAKLHHDEYMASAIETFGSILKHQTEATHHLVNQYKHSKFSQQQLTKSLNILNSTLLKNGKIVVSGIGKSHKIAAKIVATMNSLSIHAALLHPSEALHGDLGILRHDHHDCLILISSSGKSPELMQLLPHISPETRVILLTNVKNSPLSTHPQVNSLIYAELPTHLKEENIYGLTAPSISTTLCLTIADAVVIALAELYISDYNERKKIFGERHPGGAIGEAYNSTTNMGSLVSSVSSISLKTSNFSPALNPVNSNIDNDLEYMDLSKVVFDLGSGSSSVEDLSSLESYKLADSELINKFLNSDKVGRFDGFFSTELELLTAVTIYEDFLVFKESLFIETSKLKEIFKFVYNQNFNDDKERFNELAWRIKNELVRIK